MEHYTDDKGSRSSVHAGEQGWEAVSPARHATDGDGVPEAEGKQGDKTEKIEDFFVPKKTWRATVPSETKYDGGDTREFLQVEANTRG
jgi:hypothetical protein